MQVIKNPPKRVLFVLLNYSVIAGRSVWQCLHFSASRWTNSAQVGHFLYLDEIPNFRAISWLFASSNPSDGSTQRITKAMIGSRKPNTNQPTALLPFCFAKYAQAPAAASQTIRYSMDNSLFLVAPIYHLLVAAA
jgi:hypothetical protein